MSSTEINKNRNTCNCKEFSTLNFYLTKTLKEATNTVFECKGEVGTSLLSEKSKIPIVSLYSFVSGFWAGLYPGKVICGITKIFRNKMKSITKLTLFHYKTKFETLTLTVTGA